MKNDTKTIDDPCIAYGRNLRKWALPRDLLTDSEAMRQGSDPVSGAAWLPQYPAEETEDYEARRDASLVHGLFSGGVDRLASQPFGKSVQVLNGEQLSVRFNEAPDGSQGFLEDLDADGTGITDFARACYEDAAAYGITHALVRHTAQDEDDASGRPVVEHVPALALIGWIHDDAGRLVDCRISGTIVERDEENPWQEVERETVRRYYVDVVDSEVGAEGVVSEFYVMDDENQRRKKQGQQPEMRGDPVVLRDETGSPIEDIPLLTLYFRRTGPMEAEPPLFSLAEANLDHFRAKSDYDNAVHGAAVPMLAATGVTRFGGDPAEVTLESDEKISVSRVLKTPSKDAKFYWVEISGEACEAARNRVKDIEERAESLGSQPKTRAGVGTATAVWVDERSSEGRVSSWNRATEAFLTLCIWSIGDWMGEEVSREVRANIAEDRPLTQGRLDEVNAILSVHKAGGLIRRETALTALQSVLPSLEQIDPGEEVSAAEGEWERAGVGDPDDEFGAGVDMEGDEGDDDGS